MPRIQDVRHGQQQGYDRLIVELSAPCDILQRPGDETYDLIVDLAARPLQLRQELATGLSRIGSVIIAETPEGARIQSPRRERNLRLFRAVNPPRLVIDFADPRNARLPEPHGSAAVAVLPASESLIGVAPGEREPEPGALVPAPEVEAAARLLALDPPSAVISAPLPHESLSPSRLGVYTAPLVALLLGLAAAAASLALQTWRRLHMPEFPVLHAASRSRRRVRADAGSAASPRARAGMPGGPADRTELLELRHDEEVHARMQLEERVVHMQDELRILRQRLKL